MALFGKKKTKNEYNTAQSQMNQEPVTKANERIYFDEVTADDEKTLYFVSKLTKHHPLVLNFEHVDVPTANKVLAFLAGAVYALNGKTVKIDEKIYLFALSEEFLDGSLDAFIREVTN
jgi:FtsZ-interacting cell division protein YlmF